MLARVVYAGDRIEEGSYGSTSDCLPHCQYRADRGVGRTSAKRLAAGSPACDPLRRVVQLDARPLSHNSVTSIRARAPLR